MAEAAALVEITRGPFVEGTHRGHAVVCDARGSVLAAWGDPERITLPRSSVKILQAMPLVESGAADTAGLGTEQLALACASHNGAAIHTDRVAAWLDGLGLGEQDLRCGAQMPDDGPARQALRAAGQGPCQFHNNCSGKHAGFLTLNRHLGGDAQYVDPAHPVQRAVLDAFEGLTGETSPGFGIDGCSAPNFAASLRGIAAAMARIAGAETVLDGTRRDAAIRLREAMALHPLLIAGEGRACSELVASLGKGAVVKTGAEGVFIAILPEQGLGVALKIEDGATRASECALAALLVRLGVADPAHPMVEKRLNPHQLNRAATVTGEIRPTAAFYAGGAPL
ncbi:asparaginase [Paroceanicella profunda]|uniref:Asparaginase n=1 Tax=Paroceanicella profunda TaxID=2579971 RepID=A0A5B8FH41_9RHOB|nr:asparaginase [Paroceanicella profunda]QDL91747.1 asparaginase [Paroceanicella profunda]